MVNHKTSLDEELDKFSVFGRYHLQFMFLAIFTFACTTMSSHNYIFAAEESKYRCLDEIFSNYTCGSINGKKCSKWIYDDPHSFVAEFQLACIEWKRVLVGTVYSSGYMVGLLMVGPLSDRFGRKRTFIWMGVMGGIIGISKSFAHSYWLYITLEFLGGALGDNYSSFYMLNLEIVSAQKRVIFHFLCNIGSYFGGVLLPSIAWGIPYWRYYLLALYTPALLFIFYVFLIDESPRWLLTKGKQDKTIAILEKMGHRNKVKLDKYALHKLSVEDENSNIDFLGLLKITIRSRPILKRCLVCIVWWITSTFVHHGMIINSVSLKGNKYVNYGLNTLFHLPGNFILMFVLHNYKRKKPLMYSFFIAALLCFVQLFVPSERPWLSLTLYMLSSMMSNIFFDITYIYTSELFPTYTRNSMHALCSSMGRIGAILAPQTPLLLAYWSGFPTLIFGCASLAAGLVTFLVPDTADDSLPDTVREAEDIGTKNKLRGGIENLGIEQE